MFNNEDPLRILLNIKSKISFFKDLTEDEIKTLISDVKIINYKNKDVIFQEGSTINNNMYFLLSGRLLVSKRKASTNDVAKTIAVISEPSLFGEMMYFTNEPRNATITAISSESNLILSFKIEDTTNNSVLVKFYRNVISELSLKIVNMNKKLY